ncbi:MAG: tRNA pseudouridine(38-40) synthase TruA [Candidatus Omnitrophota bacterium]|nr:tRNA pseudouridine(38-40) synthase TruA [Candidatus Omnitrophota bacterium]
MTRTLKFLLAYDGTGYAGWQTQKNSRTVQETLEQALRQLTGKPVPVTGAGRTDSGVHAEGQVAHAKVASHLSLPEIQKALNAILPHDIVVRSVEIAPARFHARYSAKSKWYRYQIWNDPVRPLSERERMVHLAEHLDLGLMRRAARPLTGRRDFKRFASSGGSVRTTVRTLSLKITRKGPLVTLDFRANGFLYHMARRITGYLIEIGKGKPPPAIPPSAPAKGLCLLEVRY